MASQGESSVSGAQPIPPAPPAPAPVAPPLPAPLLQPLAPIAIRLDRENYAYWRSQVVPAVRAHDLDGFFLALVSVHHSSWIFLPRLLLWPYPR